MKTFSSSSPASLLGLATLALLGLAAAPAHAQTLTLNSGDNLTVSGAGTVGTLGGKAVSNATSFYSNSIDYGYAVETNGTAAFSLANGGTLTTAGYEGRGLYDLGSGAIAITGGTLSSTGLNSTGIYDDGSSAITISGGIISAGGLGLYYNQGTGAVTISGGSISAVSGTGLYDGSSGPITITGGTFSGGYSGLVAVGDGPISISGGTFNGGTMGGRGIYDDGNSVITISGGSINAGRGGIGLDGQQGTINLFSFGDSPFLIDGVAMNNTTLSNNLYYSQNDTISGTLANGDTLNTTFSNRGSLTMGATINLNIGTPPAAVPEASTTVSLGLLLALGVGGIAFAARRKSAV